MTQACPERPAPDPIMSETSLAHIHLHHPLAWTRLTALWGEGSRVEPNDRSIALEAHQRGADCQAILFQLNQAIGALHRFLPLLPTEERNRLTRAFPCANTCDPETLRQFLARRSQAALRTLDTHPILATGQDPFSAIMAEVALLEANGTLVLLVPFNPIPLYPVLAQRGFDHLSALTPTGWQVGFFPANGAPEPAPAPETKPTATTTPLDLRGLPPPEPMVRTLESVVYLTPGATLTILLDRVPTLLYPRLAERGLMTTTTENAGQVTVTITRPAQGD